MEPYQERVVEEKKELDEKISKLDAFLGSETSAGLADDERNRMRCQHFAMRAYSAALAARIAAF